LRSRHAREGGHPVTTTAAIGRDVHHTRFSDYWIARLRGR
jgi:hypothetical protein